MESFLGFLLIVAVLVFIFYRRANRRSKTADAERSAAPVIQSSSQSQTDEPYSFEAAGVPYYKENLMLVGEKSRKFDLSDDAFLEKCGDGGRIYRYFFNFLPTALEPEPDNPHDKNAIKVMVGGKCVGHVPANLCLQVADLLKQGYKAKINVRGGPYKYAQNGLVYIEDYGFKVYVDMTK